MTMLMLSDDDLNLRDMSDEELNAAWDLWFDLAQTTNASDPPFSHGVFAGSEDPASVLPLVTPRQCAEFPR